MIVVIAAVSVIIFLLAIISVAGLMSFFNLSPLVIFWMASAILAGYIVILFVIFWLYKKESYKDTKNSVAKKEVVLVKRLAPKILRLIGVSILLIFAVAGVILIFTSGDRENFDISRFTFGFLTSIVSIGLFWVILSKPKESKSKNLHKVVQ